MSQRLTRGALCGAVLAGICACNAGEITVFQELGDASGASNAAASGVSSVGGSAGSIGHGGAAGLAGNRPGEAGTPPHPPDRPCRDTSECDPAWLCEKQSCFDQLGMCAPRPLSEDPSSLHVCGCDQVTYWNDTLRRQYGIAASIAGECEVGARACRSSSDCAVGASCSHLLPPMTGCATPGAGTCWVTPGDCPTTGDRPHWLPCLPPDGSAQPGPPACRTTCQAVQSGEPHTPAGRGPNCP